MLEIVPVGFDRFPFPVNPIPNLRVRRGYPQPPLRKLEPLAWAHGALDQGERKKKTGSI